MKKRDLTSDANLGNFKGSSVSRLPLIDVVDGIMCSRLSIQGGHIIDPEEKFSGIATINIVNGKITEIEVCEK